MHRRTSFLLALVIVAAAATHVHADEPTGTRTTEVVGLELAPGWFNLAGQPSGGSFPIYSLGGAGTLRLVRQVWQGAYWTPVQLSLGVTGPEDGEGVLYAVSTEGGLRWRGPSRWTFEAGAALALGQLAVPYAEGCDGPCAAGASTAMLSPVVRATTTRGRLVVGAFARALAPIPGLNADRGSLGGWITRGLVALMVGVEVSVRTR